VILSAATMALLFQDARGALGIIDLVPRGQDFVAAWRSFRGVVGAQTRA
jgi:hypothetical protein